MTKQVIHTTTPSNTLLAMVNLSPDNTAKLHITKETSQTTMVSHAKM